MLVLASASPRRQELLRQAGLAFVVEPAGVDEAVAPGTSPQAAALLIAERKARAVAARRSRGDLVIGADTVVALPEGKGWLLLGKPEGPEDAARMLAMLAGTRHAVVTGVCVVPAPDGPAASAAETTWVSMRPIAAAEVRAYVASGEWRDKAGGYAIQESADRFVGQLTGGGFDNVVGLPVGLTLRLLRRAGDRPPP